VNLKSQIPFSILMPTPTISWIGHTDGYLQLIDQTLLPAEVKRLECRTVEQVWEAIKMLRVRGAPAIGVAAAYGVVVGCQKADRAGRYEFEQRLDEVLGYLATSRPTAVNLFWALDRMRRVAASFSPSPLEGEGGRRPDEGDVTDVELSKNKRTSTASPSPPAPLPPGERGEKAGASMQLLARLLAEACAIETEDREMCAALGRYGAELLKDCTGVLTHCNTGSLATAGDGTALAAIFAAAQANPKLQVFADETRPLLQGARLTAWELMQRNVSVTLICDSMAAWVMKERKVQAVIVGADRIAANGDAANKIGTYGLSVLAKAHGIPFYVSAPSSTFDLTIASGAEIPIEQRAAAEITHGFGQQTAPTNCAVYNPAFDVAPAEYIAALVTEKGVIQPVTADRIRAVLGTS
jgi:methylthioribose-1-phosphate isomerase